MRPRVRRGRRPASPSRRSALAGVTTAVASSLDRAVVLGGIARTAAAITQVSFASCWTTDETTGAMHVAAGCDDDPSPIGGVDDGVLGEVLRCQRTIAVADVRTDPRIAAPEWFATRGLRSYLAVPLMADGAAAGVLSLSDRRPIRLTAHRRAMLDALGVQAAVAIRNAHAFAASEQRRRALATLVDATQRLAHGLDLRTVLDSLAEAAALLVGGEAGVRMIEGDELVRISATSGAMRVMASERLRLGESISGRVAATGQPMFSEDTARDDRVIPEHRALDSEARVRSLVCVPIRHGARVLGTLNIYGPRGQRLDEDVLRVVSGFADQAAIAIENARLYAVSERRRRAAEAIAEVAPLLTQSLDLGVVTRRILDSVGRLVNGHSPSLYRLDRSGALVAIAVSGGIAETIPAGFTFPPGVGMGGLAVRCRETVTSPNLLEDPRVFLTPEVRRRLEGAPYRALLSTPLLVNDEVVGVLSVGDHDGRVFDQDDIHIAQGFAAQAAIAIENARQYTTSEHRRRTAEALAEVGRHLSETLDLQVVAGRVAESIRGLLGASRATVYRLDPGSGDLHAVARSTGDGMAGIFTDRLPAGTAAAGRVVQDRAPLATRDIVADSRIRLTAEQREAVAAVAQRAALAVPLLAQGNVVGALAIGDHTGRIFTDEEVRLAQAFADQAAVGLENARHFGEMEQRAERLEALARLTRRITGAIEPGDVLRFITRSAMELLDATLVELWLVRDGATLALEAGDGGEHAASRSGTIALGHGLVGRIAKSRQPEFVAAITGDERGTDLDAPAPSGAGFAGLPLVAGDHVVGVLAVVVGPERRFEAEERDLLQVFADQAAIAIEKSRLYEQTRAALADLQVKNGELDSFVYMASHDLRGPLVTIQGMMGLLVEDFAGAVDDRGRHYLTRIANAIEHMERLITDLLTLSRIGRTERVVESVCLSELVDAVLGTLERDVRARGVKIVRGDLDVVVPAVRTQLTQVLTNLIGNAVKYLGDTTEPRVEIGARDDGEHVECVVRDNGIGIDPAYHEKVFEVFERLKEVPVDGTGVGLAIVKKTVEAAGGRVRIESARGQGAAFFFTWPKTRRPS